MAEVLHKISPSFSGGEFAPSLHARVDIQKYATGARKLRNFFVHPHGGISNRPGLHYVATSKKDNSKVRVVDFQFSSDQNYVIEFGDYYCRFYTNDGQVVKTHGQAWTSGTGYNLNDITYASGNIYRCIQAHTSATLSVDITASRWLTDIAAWMATASYAIGNYVAVTVGTATPSIYYAIQAHTSGTAFVVGSNWLSQTIYEVPSPYGENDLAALRFAQSADVMFIVHPDYQPRELIRSYDTSWAFALYDFQNGPFRLANDDTTFTMQASVTTGTGTLTASTAFFHPTHVGALMQLNHPIEGQAMAQAITGSGTSSYIACGGTWRIITHGTWTGKIKVEKSDDNGATWTALRQFTGANDFNVDTYGSEDMSNGALPFRIRVNTTTMSSGTCNVDLTSDPYQSQGIAEITGYTSTTVVNATVQRVLGATATTSNWAEGAWSPYRGWPSAVTFSQDRLIFSGTSYDPQTMWMTQTGNYYDFMRNDPLVDSDGITINLPSQKLNAINGLVSLLQLLTFSSGAEFSIGGTNNNVFSPVSMQTKLNSYTGSSGVQPCVIVNRAIYVQSRGCVVRDMGYDVFTDTFSGANLSILSNHLFTNYNIVEMAYQQDPDSLVWCVRDDGKLLCMTYMREQEVLAWSWCDTYEGDDLFESVCTIPATGYNEVWVVVNRNGQRMIERMDKRLASTQRTDQFFVDSGLIYDSSDAPIVDSNLAFLSHFDGVQGATSFTDEKGNAITAHDGAIVDQTLKKFGTGSCYFSPPRGVELDYFEYATNAAAQAAYVSNSTASLAVSTASTIGTDCKLMLHMDGSGTTFVDSSASNHPNGTDIVSFYNATQSTSQKKFGTASLALDGSLDHIELQNSQDWTFGTGDFTIDAWVWFSVDTGTQCLISTTTGTFYVQQGPISSGGYLYVYLNGSAKIQQASSFATSTWHHIAVTRLGTDLRLFFNGTQLGSTVTDSTDISTPGVLGIGRNVYVSGNDFNGYIDELRIVKGTAVWTANFTPPTAAYSPAAPLLQCYSESTIKTQGDYSLKVVSEAGALGKTLTRTVSPVIDLTGVETLEFDAYSTVLEGTKTPFTLQLKSGGTSVFSITPTIDSANAWHTVTCDLSGIADGDKDSIDQIIITVAEDSAKTMYFDNFQAVSSLVYEGYLSVADNANYTNGTGNWTFDVWAAFHEIGADQVLAGQYESSSQYWCAKITSSNKLELKFVSGGVTVSDYIMASAWGLSTDTLYHLAFERIGIAAKIFINGVSRSLTEVTAFAAQDVGNASAPLELGRQNALSYFKGWMDEPRLSITNRWTDDFTPPAQAYTIYGGVTKVISGLDHLEGRTVAILSDGNVLPQQAVSGGSVTLTDAVDYAVIGLPYFPDLETLNVEVGLQDGTLQGRRVNISRVILRMLNSRGGWLGPDFTNMYELLGDYKTSTDTSLFTGDVAIPLAQGYRNDGRFCFRQVDPLPVTILGVIPLLTPGGTSQT
jgi:hypothetical protein